MRKDRQPLNREQAVQLTARLRKSGHNARVYNVTGYGAGYCGVRISGAITMHIAAYYNDFKESDVVAMADRLRLTDGKGSGR